MTAIRAQHSVKTALTSATVNYHFAVS